MNLIIIDDSASDIEYYKSLLVKNFNDFNNIESFTNPLEGLDYINEAHPDLLILDMEMPDIGGIDLLNRIKSPTTELIFCTSHDQFAIEAFKNLALGFLLKPYSESNFIAIMSKAIQRLKSVKANNDFPKAIKPILDEQVITVPTLGCTYFLKISEIIRFESVDSYAKIYLTDGTFHISSHGIKYFETSLISPIFFRVHKSHLINLTKVKKLFTDGTLVLKNGEHVPVARRRRTELLSLFNKIYL
ncbi:LytR/AlgR family response regulator transcription factor [Flavivirga spongiicola]|uniref:LytTR family DNA-binding domain-containing protein n=1 Tax=Flavivirga spongiicola TaxID=421621 RepID=A0ABU7XYF4_9FLAO|nr:LytTR family DNA-binding domain-containing protein [Flavivirga sp. MEBiC05379]MDO5980831.1 LytTR family DNA-binding domain-containing protein [Flavivirga sp. MEBiC05379]